MFTSQLFWPKTDQMRTLCRPSAVTLTGHGCFHGSARVWWTRRTAAPSLHGVRTGDRKFLRDRQWRRRLFRSVVDPVRAMDTRAANAALHSLRSQRRSLPSLSWSRGMHATSTRTMSCRSPQHAGGISLVLLTEEAMPSGYAVGATEHIQIGATEHIAWLLVLKDRYSCCSIIFWTMVSKYRSLPPCSSTILWSPFITFSNPFPGPSQSEVV